MLNNIVIVCLVMIIILVLFLIIIALMIACIDTIDYLLDVIERHKK